MHWKGRRVTVMGLGLLGGGLGTTRYAVAHGAEVTVTDVLSEAALRATLEQLRGLPVRFVLGRHDECDFRDTDLVIRNPAVANDSPFLRIAEEAGIPVETEASLFLSDAIARGIFIVGVSGTKGKTTTATLIAQGFDALAIANELTGTPGTSFLATLDRLDAHQAIVVAEFSSWDLESFIAKRMSPPIAVLTNLFPDHLNRHGSMEAYRDAKAAIARFQRNGDTVIVPADDPMLRDIAAEAPARRHLVAQEDIDALPPLRLPGSHQRSNAALALAAIRAAIAHPLFPFRGRTLDLEPALQTIASFPGLPGRLERIATLAGRVFVNDTAATNPGASRAAVEAVATPILMIAGGEDKGLPYGGFVEALAGRVRYLLLLPGTATDKIVHEITTHAIPLPLKKTASVEEAVAEAWRVSRAGDTILFSPAAASFNLFRNEFERGAAFAKAVENLSRSLRV